MQIIRSRRKTLALVMLPGGDLQVRAPQHLAQAEIEAFVAKHSAWIEKARARALAQSAAQPNLPGALGFGEGEKFPLLGKQYPLRLGSGKPPLQFNGREFRLDSAARSRAPALFQQWYRQRALMEFTLRAGLLAQRHGFALNQVRVSSARTRWGSCTSKGTLSFTWRLVMAPPEVVEYVIIHELCHLREHNHSAKFWALVGALLPGYAAQRKWLKEHGAQLDIAAGR